MRNENRFYDLFVKQTNPNFGPAFVVSSRTYKRWFGINKGIKK